MFRPITLFYTDGYKIGHKKMLAKGTKVLYGTWIPRGTKHAPKGIKKIVSFGQQLTWRWLKDEFDENFFYTQIRKDSEEYIASGGTQVHKMVDNRELKKKALSFIKDMSMYLGLEYDGKHFEELWDLGYLPVRVKALPEGIRTNPGIPHMTFKNTVDGFGWLTLYLETIVSALSWKAPTNATIALEFRKNVTEWVMKTDPKQAFLIDYLCHDFSARGLDPFSMISSGLAHATSHRGSDSVITIPAARYYYGEPEDEVVINSVNASEHSVSTTKIFTVGEKQMIIDWLKEFPTGILSIVADTFDLFKLILEYLTDPEVKALIMARDGKLVIRPDSGDPVDIICGKSFTQSGEYVGQTHRIESVDSQPEYKGVIELLYEIFGGTVNKQGYKVLDSHIGAIYGDSINLERQVQIYERLAAKGFAATNIVLGVGSFTYQFNTRDTFSFAAKGGWFEVETENVIGTLHGANGQTADIFERRGIDIYKDPATDDGTKKSPRGLLQVYEEEGEIYVKDQCTKEEEEGGLLQVIFEDGKFYNLQTLTQIRERLLYA
jgi:nicotinamide phosphoribosyltransferase